MQKKSTTKTGHSTTANGMNNYKLVIDKKTRYTILYKGKTIKRYWSLSEARDFLDYVENHERIKATMGAKV
jgi:hypothetical protein